jgi:hypothetical protein
MLREKDPTLPKFHERDGEREERMGSMKSFGNGSLKHHFRARSSALIYNLPMSFPKSDRQDRDALVPQMSEGLARPGDHVISLGQVPVLFHTLKKDTAAGNKEFTIFCCENRWKTLVSLCI